MSTTDANRQNSIALHSRARQAACMAAKSMRSGVAGASGFGGDVNVAIEMLSDELGDKKLSLLIPAGWFYRSPDPKSKLGGIEIVDQARVCRAANDALKAIGEHPDQRIPKLTIAKRFRERGASVAGAASGVSSDEG